MAININTRKLNLQIKKQLYTREAFAAASGVSVATVKHMFNAPVKSVRQGTVKKMCDCLGIDPEEILADEQ